MRSKVRKILYQTTIDNCQITKLHRNNSKVKMCLCEK